MHHHNLDHKGKALSAEIKELKHMGMKDIILTIRNLAIMLYHEKEHKQKIMNNETMKVKRVFKSYGKI
jgi:hypothetical protein